MISWVLLGCQNKKYQLRLIYHLKHGCFLKYISNRMEIGLWIIDPISKDHFWLNLIMEIVRKSSWKVYWWDLKYDWIWVGMNMRRVMILLTSVLYISETPNFLVFLYVTPLRSLLSGNYNKSSMPRLKCLDFKLWLN
jgi:hypothetical protein